MSGVTVACRQCGHKPSEHDGYGCGVFMTGEWAKGICSCNWTKHQLLELDRVPSGLDEFAEDTSLNPRNPPGNTP